MPTVFQFYFCLKYIPSTELNISFSLENTQPLEIFLNYVCISFILFPLLFYYSFWALRKRILLFEFMYKDAKNNKSPIQSILHQSFGHLPSASMLLSNNNLEQSFNDNDFQVSDNSNANANIQKKLKIVQSICTVQLEISIHSIISILRQKAINRLSIGVNALKRNNTQNNKRANLSLQKSDQIIIIRKVQCFYHRIDTVMKRIKLKYIGTSFSQIYFLRYRSANTEKSSSVSPYRYSKVEGSQRDSYEELAQSQGNVDNTQTIARENKYLKNKKKKIKENREEFYSKIDEVLAFHQKFLNKK